MVLAGIRFLIMTPFFAIARIAAGETPPWPQSFGAVLLVVGISYGLGLLFLLLSFASGFHREPLRRLLHLAEPMPPPAMQPSLTVPGAAT